MEKIKVDEYIIIRGTQKTARIIEIYSVEKENDRLFHVYFPDGATRYVFESQVLTLSQFEHAQRQ